MQSPQYQNLPFCTSDGLVVHTPYIALGQMEETNLFDEVRNLRKKIDEESSDSCILVSLLRSLKELENQESGLRLQRDSDCSKLQEEVEELNKILYGGDCDSFDRFLMDSHERLESAKKDLASKLRLIVSLKRQLDEVPSEAELIQYELRSSELNTQIQKKHRQTRKHYDTYNALVECKELMLKETSLLDSITVQFQNANSADGRIKLIKPLEGILEGIQQKLEKAETTLQSERKNNDALEEKYAATIREGRRSSSLLKLFQEECKRKEGLRAQIT